MAAVSLALLAPPLGTAAAQNPIASKVVGSSVAAVNRDVARSEAGERPEEVANAISRRYAAQIRSFIQPSTQLQATGGGDETAASAREELDSLRLISTLRPVVDEALRLEAARQRLPRTDPRVAERALQRVVDAELNGHTNPERWYLGGQVGAKLFGAGNLGSVMRASARATYFVPISPLRRWQLPVLTNLSTLGAGGEGTEEQLARTVTSADGAYLSVEPTWDPVYRTPFRDMRLQPFVAVGTQLNTLKAAGDTIDVSFGQARFGAGTNFEIGTRTGGETVLFLSTRAVLSVFSADAYERAFGERRRSRAILETYALVPIGGSTALLAEVSAARGSAPVVRLGFWSQAAPGGEAAGAGAPTAP